MLVPVETTTIVAADPASYSTFSSHVTSTVIATAPVYADCPHLNLVIVGRPIPVDVDVPASPPSATSISSSALVLSLPVAAVPGLRTQPELVARTAVTS